MFIIKWMELKINMLGEISYTKKGKSLYLEVNVYKECKDMWIYYLVYNYKYFFNELYYIHNNTSFFSILTLFS